MIRSALYWSALPELVPDRATLAAWSALLDAHELRSMGRRATPILRARYAAAHAWQRRMVADHVICATDAVEWTVDAHGKPRLGQELRRWSTNLTHDDHHVALAISPSGSVGIDIEAATVEPVDAPDVLSAAEDRFVTAGCGSERNRLFAVVWTRKEAWAKQSGLGLRGPLCNITLISSDPNIDVVHQGRRVSTYCLQGFVLSVASVDDSIATMQFQPVHRPLSSLIAPPPCPAAAKRARSHV